MEDSGIDSDPKNLLGNGDDLLFQVSIPGLDFKLQKL